MADETQQQKRLRGIRRDSRNDGSVEVAGYQNESGNPLAWTGDDEAPYVKVISSTTDPIIIDVFAPTASSTGAYNMTYQPAGSATAVVKASPGRCYQCYVFNPSGGVRTFQLFNRTTPPLVGSVPFMTPIELPDDTALFLDFGLIGAFFPVGIVMVSSSTVATFTGSAGLHMTMFWF